MQHGILQLASLPERQAVRILRISLYHKNTPCSSRSYASCLEGTQVFFGAMSFHIKRSQTSQLETLQQYGGIRSTRWVQPPQGKSVLEIQTTHLPTALQKVPDGKNYLTPPYHCT
jgi:hypothetical protein